MQKTRKRQRRRGVGAAALAVALGLASLATAMPGNAAPAVTAPGTNAPGTTLPNNKPDAPDNPACSSSSVQLTAGTGSAPQNLCVPAQATEADKTLLVWNKPGSYDDVVDYRVYINGRPVGTAEENARIHSPAQE